MTSAVCAYPRWKQGLYCDPAQNRYRQHPLDYIESLERCVGEALAKCGAEVAANIRGISFDTTASTPVLTDQQGTPLALLPEFAENPDAMFVLWKDHTALAEADCLNDLANAGRPTIPATAAAPIRANGCGPRCCTACATTRR